MTPPLWSPRGVQAPLIKRKDSPLFAYCIEARASTPERREVRGPPKLTGRVRPDPKSPDGSTRGPTVGRCHSIEFVRAFHLLLDCFIADLNRIRVLIALHVVTEGWMHT